MTKLTWIQRSIPLAAAALVGTAPVVVAQGQQLFQWTGRVDREVQIVMRGNQISTRRIGATEPNFAQGRAMSDLPRQDGVVRVQVMQGRGNVAVIQQPNAQNGFTTVVRIQDPRQRLRLVSSRRLLGGLLQRRVRRLAGSRTRTRPKLSG